MSSDFCVRAEHVEACPERVEGHDMDLGGPSRVDTTTAYLAFSPKSNALYLAEKAVKAEIESSGAQPVPLHIRNAPTKLMKELGYARGYL